MASDGRSDIVDFFAGKTVFLTGFSGFIGKLVVEKLIRVCRVKRVYVLMRGKKGKDPQDRVKELLELPVFDKLRQTVPEFENIIVAVSGECSLPNLGLSDDDRKRVTQETEVCFHGAALLNMQANIKEATTVNVRGTRDYIALAKQMPKLAAMTYVSTAFSQCPLVHVYEKFYDCGVDPNGLIEQMETLEASVAESLTPKMLGDAPNTYVYTKRVAENLIRDECVGMPVNIFRPSSVISCFKEPIPGWIDNFYGATGLIVGVALGVIRMAAVEDANIGDLVPADYVVNAMLASSYETARRKGDEIKIYTFSSGVHNPITIGDVKTLTMQEGKNSIHKIWHHFHFTTTNVHLLTIGFFLLHTLPGYLMDGVMLLLGKERRFVKIYEKINKMEWTMRTFYLNSWRFDMRNTYNLWHELSRTDRLLFDFDIANLDWNAFFRQYLLGCRRYLVKESDDTIPAGERKATVLKYIHYAIVSVLGYYLLKLVHVALDFIFTRI